ncbi:hypothetical protein EG329_006201 [Mollisiaceae sp. DMI_Dod_QoI]|nr:hypothetical protein EG329_006201 [Helotiales sp. DMI_Dod_QoI]
MSSNTSSTIMLSTASSTNTTTLHAAQIVAQTSVLVPAKMPPRTPLPPKQPLPSSRTSPPTETSSSSSTSKSSPSASPSPPPPPSQDLLEPTLDPDFPFNHPSNITVPYMLESMGLPGFFTYKAYLEILGEKMWLVLEFDDDDDNDDDDDDQELC